MSTCTLYHGDCLEVMPKLATNSVAMVFADLPYAFAKRRCTDNKWDKGVDLSAFRQSAESLCRERAALCFTATQPFATAIINEFAATFRYDLVWVKNKMGNFLNSGRMPLRGHENILVCYTKTPTYNPQKTAGLSYNRQDSGADSACYGPRKSRPGRIHRTNSTGLRHPSTVLKIGCEQRTMHPTQKPVALLEWLISTYTDKSDTVLDPVFGSATTAVACARLGRHFVGIEKDAKYFRIGTDRVNTERAKLGLQPCEVQI